MRKTSLPTAPLSICKPLGATLACAALLGTNARAADTNTTQLPTVVVTGSLIPTAETVGPAPVETVTAAELEQTGATDALQAIRKISTAFAGNGNVGQT